MEINTSELPVNENNSGGMIPEIAERKLEIIGKKIGATEDGIHCISNLLDVMKDSSLDPEGWPDLVSSKHIVQKVQGTYTFSRPSMVPSGNWDCSIYMSPLATNAYIVQYNDNASAPNIVDVNDRTNANPPFLIGGVEFRAGTPGTNLTYVDLVHNEPLDTKYTNDSNVRVIGQGFEICNTTNELNVQGSVTIFRVVGADLEETTNLQLIDSSDITFPRGSINTYSMPQIPETQAEAKITPGSKTWKAKYGCYCNSTMASETNRPYDGRYLTNVPYYKEFSTSTNWTSDLQRWPGNSLVPDLQGGTHKPLFGPFNVSGAFFSGLSADSTLTVNFCWIVERFPTFANTDLIVLSKRATLYDPKAMELYARIADLLPVGEYFSDNDLGTWITTIADIAGMAGIPFMNLVGPAVNAIRTMIKTTPQNNKANSPIIVQPKMANIVSDKKIRKTVNREQQQLNNMKRQLNNQQQQLSQQAQFRSPRNNKPKQVYVLKK